MPPAAADPLPAAPPLQAGLCLDCYYPLRDLGENRCPECGRPFDPRLPRTMNMGGRPGPVARLFLRAVPWPVMVFAALPLLPLLWIATDPMIYGMFGEYLLSGFTLVPVAAVCAGWLGIKSWLVQRHGQPESVLKADVRRWRPVGWFAAGVVLLVLLKVPLRVAFLASRPALERVAAQARAAPAAPFPARAGWYRITDVEDHYGMILIFTDDSHANGFRHSPHSRGRYGWGGGEEGRVFGPWYWFNSD